MEEVATPAVVRWLQARRLVLQRRHHMLHHTAPFDSHNCMSSGWLNRPLNALLRASYVGQLVHPFRKRTRATPYG